MQSSNFSSGARKQKGPSRFLTAVFVLLLVFVFGVSVGKGDISFGQPRFGSTSNELPQDLNYQEVEALYDKLRNYYDGQLTEEELIKGLKEGLVSATGDLYTEYLTADEAQDFSEDLNGTFSGIGARLMQNENDMVMVEVPLAGYPAEKAGLRSKDVIVEINGESAYNLSVTDAVDKIRGEEGTNVKLKVVRNDSEQIDFEITRETITIPSVEAEIIEGDIGYMQVSRFDNSTGQLAREAAQNFKDANVKGVILDLRNNPGGVLDSATELSGIWLPQGKVVVEVKRSDVVLDTQSSNGPGTLAGVPTIVLINEGSASASEITAGALKDHEAATLLGQKTFGKGTVQTIVDLSDGGQLKVTSSRWNTFKSDNIDKEGIEPDKKVERSVEDIQEGRDPQKDEAVKLLK